MKVCTLGPNLVGATTTFVVHADGCADIKRDCTRHHVRDHGYRDDVDSREALVNLVYDFVQDEDPEGRSAWALGHESEFDFKPCTNSLPAPDVRLGQIGVITWTVTHRVKVPDEKAEQGIANLYARRLANKLTEHNPDWTIQSVTVHKEDKP